MQQYMGTWPSLNCSGSYPHPTMSYAVEEVGGGIDRVLRTLATRTPTTLHTPHNVFFCIGAITTWHNIPTPAREPSWNSSSPLERQRRFHFRNTPKATVVLLEPLPLARPDNNYPVKHQIWVDQTLSLANDNPRLMYFPTKTHFPDHKSLFRADNSNLTL